jgi:hypothetical protein
VRLNDSYLRSIVYIGVDRHDGNGGIDTHGTGFLLAHDGHVYLVTAAHVAVNFIDGAMDIRLNKEGGELGFGLGRIEHFDETNWFFHQLPNVDVAVMPIQVPAWARAVPLKSKHIATDFKVSSKDIGPGTLAHVVGIFNKMRGKDKNEPFVHTGHIASMGRGEKAVMEDWRPGAKAGATLEVHGYLVQATTLPESSGSPVFARRSFQVKDVRHVDPTTRTMTTAPTWAYGSIWLLGIWSGAWETHDEKAGVIVGDDMGLCTPAPRIIEVLEQDELKVMRKARR